MVVHAQAFGEAQEHDLLLPMVAATRENFQAIGRDRDVFERTALATDSGFHTEANVQALFEQKIDAYIADNQFRKRDPRFATAQRHRARHLAEASGSNTDTAGGVLQGSSEVSQTKLHHEDEAKDRHPGRPTAVQPTLGYRRAGIWSSRQCDRLKTLQSTRLGEGEYPVEAILYRA